MRKSGRVVGKALAVVAALALGYLVVVGYGAEIAAFLGRNWLWVLLGLVVWTLVAVVLGLVIGVAIRNRDLPARARPPTPAPPADAADQRPAEPSIPAPTVPDEGESGVPLPRPARRPPTTG